MNRFVSKWHCQPFIPGGRAALTAHRRRSLLSVLLALTLFLSAFAGSEVRAENSGGGNGDLLPIKSNGKAGYLDRNGNVVVPLKYDETWLFSEEGLGKVRLNGKEDYIDQNGREITSLKYDRIFFDEGLLKIELNGKKGYADRNGREVIPLKYDEVSIGSKKVLVKLNGKWGFIDKSSREITPLKYDEVRFFSEDLSLVGLNGKWVYLGESGQEITSLYDETNGFFEGLAPVKLNGKWGYIDETGQEVIQLKYEDAKSFSEGLASVKLNGKWGFIDENEREITPLKYDETNVFWGGGRALVKLNGKWGYIDKMGREVIPLKYDAADSFYEGLAAVCLNGNWGYIDKSGRKITSLKYDRAYSYIGGYARVELNGKDGIIDESGREIITPLKYMMVNGFYEGLALAELLWVGLNGEYGYKYGYIDTNAREVVPVRYDGLEEPKSYPELVRVWLDGRNGYFDKNLGRVTLYHPNDRDFWERHNRTLPGVTYVPSTPAVQPPVVAYRIKEDIKQVESYYNTGSYQKALDELNRIAAKAVTEEDKLYILVWEYVLSYRLSRAAELAKLAELLKQAELDRVQNSLLMARYYSVLGDQERTLNQMSQAMKDNPDNQRFFEQEQEFQKLKQTESFQELVRLKENSIPDVWYSSLDMAGTVGDVMQVVRGKLAELNDFQRTNSRVLEQLTKWLEYARSRYLNLLMVYQLNQASGKVSFKADFAQTLSQHYKAFNRNLAELLEQYKIVLNRQLVADTQLELPYDMSSRQKIDIYLKKADLEELKDYGYLSFRYEGDGISLPIKEFLEIWGDAAEWRIQIISGEGELTVYFYRDGVKVDRLAIPYYLFIAKKGISRFQDSGQYTIYRGSDNLGGIFRESRKGIEVRTEQTGEFRIRQENVKFSDISDIGYYSRYNIEALAVKNMIKGVGNEQFAPERSMTRAEFVTLLIRAMALAEKGGSQKFVDVSSSDWFAPYVAAASSHQLVKGKTATEFKPQDAITRNEAVTICAREIRNKMGYQITAEEIKEVMKIYTDFAAIPDWAAKEVACAYHSRLIGRSADGKFGGSRNLTRQEGADLIAELYQLLIRQ